ncbi:hypothetical protein [Ilyomonas limi]|uniref:hypothetical protein n=1 Tax=Ilyomonas limi TaxID=2575867 RepID=UPI0014855157|nr:hypothetical protein [Ilyomonas limi]
MNKYVNKNGYSTGRNERLFNSQEEAELKRQDAKEQWKNSGYNIGGYNYFFGDCTE